MLGLVFNIIYSFSGDYAFGVVLMIAVCIPYSLSALIAGIICYKAAFRSASTTAIALDNANAYREVENKNSKWNKIT